MARKRTSLDALFTPSTEEQGRAATVPATPRRTGVKTSPPPLKSSKAPENNKAPEKPDIVKQSVYLPAEVYEQLRALAFDERRKMHDYLMEGLDLVFQHRGLKPITELTRKAR